MILQSLRKRKIQKNLEVEFDSHMSTKGLNAKNINILKDFKSVHLEKRLTRGKKSDLNYKGTEEEVKISEKFSKYFGITFLEKKDLKNQHIILILFNHLKLTEKVLICSMRC